MISASRNVACTTNFLISIRTRNFDKLPPPQPSSRKIRFFNSSIFFKENSCDGMLPMTCRIEKKLNSSFYKNMLFCILYGLSIIIEFKRMIVCRKNLIYEEQMLEECGFSVSFHILLK